MKIVLNLVSFLKSKAKIFVILNLLLVFIFAGGLVYKKITKGYIFEKDISLKGGTIVKIEANKMIYELIKKEFGDIYDISYSSPFIVIKGESVNETSILETLYSKYNITIPRDKILVEEYSAYFSDIIFREFSKYVIISLILIAVALYFRIRARIPAIAIFLTLVFDLLGLMFVVSILDIPIRAIAFVAFLMILGYGIDNNIVLATNMLKEEKMSFEERSLLSLKIGLLMELTTIIVLAVVYYFIYSPEIHQLATLLLIGLLLDMYYYIFGNIPLYAFFLEKSAREEQKK